MAIPGCVGEQIRQRDGLALVDFLARDEIDGSGSLAGIERLGIGGDDDVIGSALISRRRVELARLGWGEFRAKSRETKDGMVEIERDSGPEGTPASRRRRMVDVARQHLGSSGAVELRGHADGGDTGAAGIQQRAR